MGTYNTNSQTKFKTTMLKANLCDSSDTYLLVKGTITVAAAGATPEAIQVNENNKQALFKNCAPYTDLIVEINNTQVDSTKDIDVLMPMYKLMKYVDNFSKTTESLHQFQR